MVHQCLSVIITTITSQQEEEEEEERTVQGRDCYSNGQDRVAGGHRNYKTPPPPPSIKSLSNNNNSNSNLIHSNRATVASVSVRK